MRLGATDLDVFPLCLGGNVFGRGADERQSFEVLDAYAAAGGNFIDTANIYAEGASEEILGRWMAVRRNRAQMVIATKVGMGSSPGLGPQRIREALEESLGRLLTDHVDLYYAHVDDRATPLEDTLSAFDALVRAGKARHIAASNYDAARLAQALAVSDREGLARYAALQPHYNLVVRSEYEGELQDLCEREGLPCLPYYSLAKGFLTGKYRPDGPPVDSRRATGASAYLDERGLRILDVLDRVSASRGSSQAAVALAWLRAQPTVATPIASARTVEQLEQLLPMATLSLSESDLDLLTQAGR